MLHRLWSNNKNILQKTRRFIWHRKIVKKFPLNVFFYEVTLFNFTQFWFTNISETKTQDIPLTLSGPTFWRAWFGRGRGGVLSAPPRKSMKEMCETPYCYLEVRHLSKLGTHEKFQVEISKTGWDFIIWKFDEIEISLWVDSRKCP